MPRIGTVDERFQSYNIEMVEVTGGQILEALSAKSGVPRNAAIRIRHAAGMDPNLFQYRPPIDLTNARLRKLAAALAPAYVRVSGTWANSTYFADSDTRRRRRRPDSKAS